MKSTITLNNTPSLNTPSQNNVKKLFAIVLGFMLPLFACNAQQTKYDWNDIDTVTFVKQTVLDNKKVYIYATSKAAYKEGSDKKIKKQQEAVAEMADYMEDVLKKKFKNTDFETVSDPSQAPADAIVIKATITEINWGSKAARMWVGFGVGNINGKYTVELFDAGQKCFELRTHRYHDTSIASEKGEAVIKAYSKAMAKDVITCLTGKN